MAHDTRRLADDIRFTLTHASLCYEAWWIFEGEHEMRSQILSVYNRYLDFFQTVRPALFTTFILKLASLFGNDPREITLKLLPGISNHPSFKNLRKRGERLYKYRSKVIAHRDKDILSHDFAKETGFTYDALKAILDDSKKIFDVVATQEGFDRVYRFSCEEDLLALIK
jgi:hypothetical protein